MTKIDNTLQRRAQMLEETQWANEFTWREIVNLARYLYPARFAKGSTIVSEGSRGADLYLLVEGSVTVIKGDESGLEKVLTVVTKGKVIGEMALFDGEPRSAKVVASQEVTALVLSRDNLDRLTQEMPKLSAKLLLKLGALISSKLRITSGILVDRI